MDSKDRCYYLVSQKPWKDIEQHKKIWKL